MTEFDMKSCALRYAVLGLAVFPLRTRNKTPLTTNGYKDASTDLKQIEAWWNKYPSANIGIATGKPSGGLVVVDLDVDEEKGIDGRETLREWEKQHGKLPDNTWISITGRGGYHYFYKDQSGSRSKAGLYEGVDIRGEGGYIVAPPSIHPNGHRYEWEQAPGEIPLAAADYKVNEFLYPAPPKWEQSFFSLPDQIPEGGRVNAMVKLVCSQQSKGLSDEAIKAAVRAENEKKCVPPLTERELEKEVFPAIGRYQKGTSPYYGEKDYSKRSNWNGQPPAQHKKIEDFHLDQAAQVEIKEPEWLIPGYIPKYGITTIAGEGGVGKTSLWCSIVASITTGKQHFLVSGQNIPFQNKPENVVVFSAEDSWEYVLKRRLEANGADMDRISYMGANDERFVDLNFDGDLLKGIIETNRPDLVIYDPVQAFVPANLRMGDRNAMRKCFTPLIGFGETYRTTSIIIAHANKQSGVWGRKRIADSSDIWDSSRSVLMTGMVPNSENLRYITHEKSNWGKLEDSVLYELNEGVPIFKGYTKKKDKEFILEDSRNKNVAPAAEDAKEFILGTLEEQGQMEISELDELAKVNGITSNALKNAKAALKKEGRTHVWSIGFNPKKFYITLKATGKTNEYEENP